MLQFLVGFRNLIFYKKLKVLHNYVIKASL